MSLRVLGLNDVLPPPDGANICQISENQWREVHFMREGEHSTCPIKI